MKEKDLQEIELLNFIYQNADMGIIGINDIEDKVEDLNFLELIKRQKEEYKKISDECIQIFIKYGKEEKELGAMPKIMSYIMANLKTMTDKSTSNLAKMMIEGSNKGVVEITEKLNCYEGSDEEIKTLGEKLLATEEHNIEDLKPYL